MKISNRVILGAIGVMLVVFSLRIFADFKQDTASLDLSVSESTESSQEQKTSAQNMDSNEAQSEKHSSPTKQLRNISNTPPTDANAHNDQVTKKIELRDLATLQLEYREIPQDQLKEELDDVVASIEESGLIEQANSEGLSNEEAQILSDLMQQEDAIRLVLLKRKIDELSSRLSKKLPKMKYSSR